MIGLCSSHEDPELWFAEDEPGIAAAKAVCAACPMLEPCRVLGAGEPWGTYGGVSAEERAEALAAEFMLSDLPGPKHGERSTYNSGCHCGPCTAANTAYVAGRPRRTAPVTPAPKVDAAELTIGLEVA